MDPLRGISNAAKLFYYFTVCTCEFFLAAVSHTLLQILELVFHLLILPLCLLTLSPDETNTTQVPSYSKFVERILTKSWKIKNINHFKDLIVQKLHSVI